MGGADAPRPLRIYSIHFRVANFEKCAALKWKDKKHAEDLQLPCKSKVVIPYTFMGGVRQSFLVLATDCLNNHFYLVTHGTLF